MKTQRGFISLIGIIIVVLLIGGGVYLYTNNTTQVADKNDKLISPDNYGIETENPINRAQEVVNQIENKKQEINVNEEARKMSDIKDLGPFYNDSLECPDDFRSVKSEWQGVYTCEKEEPIFLGGFYPEKGNLYKSNKIGLDYPKLIRRDFEAEKNYYDEFDYYELPIEDMYGNLLLYTCYGCSISSTDNKAYIKVFRKIGNNENIEDVIKEVALDFDNKDL